MIKWENLSKSYGRRRLFSELSGAVGDGSSLLVTGFNGSGKSTFLKILAGLVRADRGAVMRPRDRNAVGYAAPHMALYGELTGIENVQFAMGVRGLKSDSAVAVSVLARMGLELSANKLVSAYSTGMVQRAKIACAIAHEPALLILDEPTIGLDRDGVNLVEELVAEHVAGRTGGGAIIATNEPEHFARLIGSGWAGLDMGV